MKAMNIEAAKWRKGAGDETTVVVVDDATLARRRRNRNIVIAALVVLIAAAAIAYMTMGGAAEEKAPAKGGPGSAPTVTVVVPGRQDIPAVLSATGSIAARRDLPVGVPGEGGQVERVLVEPGQWVRAGQALAVINRSVQTQEAAQLGASIQVAQADLRLAEQELARASQLVSRGFVSAADVDRKRATRDAAAARVRVAQAQLGAARARIGRLDIRAPAAGLVLDRNVEAGQVVGPGTGALFRIAQGGEMELLARLPQTDLARLSVGVPVTVTPVGSASSYQGVVWQLAPTIDAQTRQGEVRILIPYNRELRPGGFASAQIRAGSTTAPLLPESAVLTDDNGTFVMIVGPNSTVQRRAVRVGSVTDRGVVVADGLAGTEQVVESAGAFLNAGERISPNLRAAARR
ncbi:MAG TPA: efflux RND transporter periplasmic adaptor subunit [Allosphingosinicella sp.]|jgi:RND family efflux transporter MFP subunit|nr:efflux RND transporter periplasmic adaptor subunit [Allosphingosinicella sp.]